MTSSPHYFLLRHGQHDHALEGRQWPNPAPHHGFVGQAPFPMRGGQRASYATYTEEKGRGHDQPHYSLPRQEGKILVAMGGGLWPKPNTFSRREGQAPISMRGGPRARDAPYKEEKGGGHDHPHYSLLRQREDEHWP